MAFPTASPGLPLALIVVTVLAVGRTSAADDVRMMQIADDAFAGSSVNVVANARQALFTHGDTQYAGFYDAAGFMVLAKRFVAAEHWETERTRYHGNVADAHNSISLAVDDAGFLHVAWDHHGNPLNYARSVAPGSLQLGPRRAMTGRREERVTYPQFHLLANGDLLFLYRDGASGNGSLVLDRYDAASRTWRMVQSDLIDGEDRRSPYWDLTIGPTGTLHLAWVWRESPDVGTNHDLAYARSADGGVTWTRTDGSRYALPITAETAEYARRIPQRHNLMNSPMIAADAADHPYVCTYWSPSPDRAPQFQVVHHDGTAWQLIAGPTGTPRFTLGGTGTKRPPISRAVLLVENTATTPALHLIYRDDARGGRAVLASRLGGRAADGSWTVQDLATPDLGGWEPAIDPVAWSRFRQAQLLVEPVIQRDGDDREAASRSAPIAALIWPVATGKR